MLSGELKRMKKPARAVVLLLAPAFASAVLLLSRSANRAGRETPGGAFSGAASLRSGGESAGRASESRVAAARALQNVPLSFIENRGQLDSRVAFSVQGRDTTLYFTSEGMTLALDEPNRGEGAGGRLERLSFGQSRRMPRPRSHQVVKLDFVGADPNPEILPGDPTPTLVSYFKGRPETWKAGLATYASITYSNLWPGIDLVYSGAANRLKYSFLVKPGADPAQIRLAYRGVSAVKVNGAGQLEIETPAGVLQDDRPDAYQEIDGRRMAIDVAYSLDRARGGAPHGYGFAVHPYDRTKALVLDPAMLVYAGYIGGDDDDEAFGIAVDGSGNAYVTGFTASTEATFPVAVGPDPTYNGAPVDAFVAKVNAAGTSLLYCGYIGGDDDDEGYGIAVDGSGNAYVTGLTASTEATFPVTVGPGLTYNGGPVDAFVAKVNAAGTSLLYCGYIGGDDDDEAFGIAVDGSGNAYVTGRTASTEATFPVSVGPDPTYNGGLYDAFVAKVNAAGDALVYCGYIGGNSFDEGFAIAVDSSGNAYVTGDTASTEASFPVTVGPYLTYNGGSGDAFVAKVNAAGNGLTYCGYVGGSGSETAWGVAVDSSGNAYLAGETSSTEADFPVAVGPYLTYNGGSADAFVAKVNAAGTVLAYCGYIGGSGVDTAHGIAVDSAGNAYVAGITSSSEATFPVSVGPDLTYNLGGDAFVAKIDAAGDALVYCGYAGGSGDDESYGIAVDASGNAYITGFTNSHEDTFPVSVGPDTTYNGDPVDAFVAKVESFSAQTPTPTNTPTNTPTSTPTVTPAPGLGYFTLSPCRQYDSRDSTPLPDDVSRFVTLVGAPCGVPTSATAVSVNITVFNITGAGGNAVFQVGIAAHPTFAWINYPPGETQRGNAGFLPLNVSGQIVVKVNQGGGMVDFTVDINGYFQ